MLNPLALQASVRLSLAEHVLKPPHRVAGTKTSGLEGGQGSRSLKQQQGQEEGD